MKTTGEKLIQYAIEAHACRLQAAAPGLSIGERISAGVQAAAYDQLVTSMANHIAGRADRIRRHMGKGPSASR